MAKCSSKKGIDIKKMDDIFDKKRRSQILILVVADRNYTEKLNEISLQVYKRLKKTCYVTLNKPYTTMAEIFREKKISIDNFVFIDAVDKGASIKNKNVVYVSSPGALTEIDIEIHNILENKNVDGLIVDSVSTLMIYENRTKVIKFLHDVMTLLRMKALFGLFVALKSDVDKNVTKDINMFVDKIIEI